MRQGRENAAGSRWHEWIIVISIAALAVIGVTAIWGSSIRRWIDSASDRPAAPASQPRGASGSRL